VHLADTSLDPFQILVAQAGVVGVVVVLLMMGQLYTGKSVQRERDLGAAQLARDDAELARRQALIDTLLAVYHHEVLPTLSDVDRRMVPLMEKTETALNRLEPALQRTEATLARLEVSLGKEERASSRRRGVSTTQPGS